MKLQVYSALQQCEIQGCAVWHSKQAVGLIFILPESLLFKITFAIWNSGCLPISCKCRFLCKSKILYDRMHWIMMLHWIHPFKAKAPAHISHPQRLVHDRKHSDCDHADRLTCLHSTLQFLWPPLPAFCPSFQVPALLELWESRCLVIVYSEIQSTQPLGWNPLASVRREIFSQRTNILSSSRGQLWDKMHNKEIQSASEM